VVEAGSILLAPGARTGVARDLSREPICLSEKIEVPAAQIREWSFSECGVTRLSQLTRRLSVVKNVGSIGFSWRDWP